MNNSILRLFHCGGLSFNDGTKFLLAPFGKTGLDSAFEFYDPSPCDRVKVDLQIGLQKLDNTGFTYPRTFLSKRRLASENLRGRSQGRKHRAMQYQLRFYYNLLYSIIQSTSSPGF